MARLLAAPLLGALALAGCGNGTHLHDAGKAALAAGIVQRFAGLDLAGPLAGRRQALAALLTEETRTAGAAIDLARDRTLWDVLAQLDAPLAAMLAPRLDETRSGPAASSRGASYPTRRLAELGIAGAADMAAVLRLRAALAAAGPVLLADADPEVVAARGDLAAFGWPLAGLWPCARIAAATAAELAALAAGSVQADALLPGLMTYRLACGDALAAERAVRIFASSLPGGPLRAAYAALVTAQATAAELERGRAEIAAVLVALATPQSADEGGMARLRQAADRLARVLAALKGSAAGPGAEEELARSRVEALALLLQAARQGRTVRAVDEAGLLADRRLDRALVAAAGLAALGGSLEGLLRRLAAPEARSDLLLEAAHQRVRLAFLEQRQAQAAATIVQLQQRLLALLDEVLRLHAIGEALALLDGPAPGGTPWRVGPALAASAPAPVRREAHAALLALVQSFAARRRAAMLDRALDDGQERLGLLADGYALEAWGVLIAGPLRQLAAYHAAGLRPDAAARLLSGLAGLGLIGTLAAGVP